MFRMNVKFIKTIRETLNIKKFDGCHIDTISMIHHYLFRENAPVASNIPKVKTKFFTPKVKTVPNKEYEEYHEYNEMIKAMQRPQSRNF